MVTHSIDVYHSQYMPPPVDLRKKSDADNDSSKATEVESTEKKASVPKPTETMGNNVNVMA